MKHAGGIPRSINILCGNALATGYGYQKTHIDAPIALEVIKDMEGERRRPFLRKLVLAAAAAAAAILCIAGALLLDPSPLVVFSTQERQPVFSAAAIQAPAPSVAPPKDATRPENVARQERVAPSGKAMREVVRTVKKGDTMIDLILDVYGARESRRIDVLLGKIKKSNPHIKNPNLILQGQEILFPDVRREIMEAQQ